MNKPMPRDPDHWVYAQLFLPKTLPAQDLLAAADAVVLGDLAPLAATFDTQGRPWFFVRYLEQGYHLRLRVHAASAARRAQLVDQVAAACARPLAQGAQLRFAAYEPEYDKYAGVQGNALAEQHFGASSKVALRVLADQARPLSERALHLLLGTLDAAGLDTEQSAAWCRAYYDYWWRAFGAHPACEQADDALFQRSRAALAQRLGAGATAQAGWASDWTQALREVLAQAQALERAAAFIDPAAARDALHQRYPYPVTQLSLLPNFWHMLCNRLGVSIRQEMHLAYCLMRHLSLQHGIEPLPMTISLIPDHS